MQKKEPKETGLYMYGIISMVKDIAFGAIGLSENEKPTEVLVVPYQDIACIVSPSPIKEWDITRENMMTHQRVNELAMQKTVVLPIKFGTIAEDADQIAQRFLKSRYDEFRKELAYFGDKEEHGVRGLWLQMEGVYADLIEEMPQLKMWRDRLSKQPPQKVHKEAVLLGEAVQKGLNQKKEALQTELFEKLKSFATESKQNKIMGDRMVFNGVFLVQKEEQGRFDAVVNALSEEYKRTLQFKYVGPTPPANFIEIVVKWDESSV